ncbi:MAG: hypothetical protein KIT60_06850 [Burkholderiaceae bacterium]|nr:hypothetical protein [Burkholderiaceae bacterium]
MKVNDWSGDGVAAASQEEMLAAAQAAFSQLGCEPPIVGVTLIVHGPKSNSYISSIDPASNVRHLRHIAEQLERRVADETRH